MTEPIYFVETTFQHVRGQAFIECDRDTNSRRAVLDLIRTGEVKPVCILEIDEESGTVRNVTAEMMEEAGEMEMV